MGRTKGKAFSTEEKAGEKAETATKSEDREKASVVGCDEGEGDWRERENGGR